VLETHPENLFCGDGFSSFAMCDPFPPPNVQSLARIGSSVKIC
jgi:hypothetical protein